ncbi:MAG: hypothetical protein JWM80_1166 [Cyanobacteria bacterium RYN_339]|nr:hypothetical protein [Cyanobacteria bacterium RYN_339]
MTVLHLGGRTAIDFALPYPPEVAFRYFARNEGLLKQFLGEDRVDNLGDGVYRVRLNPHGALGLTLQPSFDVAFIEHPPDRVEMKSLRASLVEASHDDTGFEARFEGEANFKQVPEGTLLRCSSRMDVALTLPGFLAWMPAAPLEALGNGLIQTAMGALSHRLVPLMQRDIAKWVVAMPPAGR